MDDQSDLGELFAAITRRLIDAERPLLAARGLSMWGYVALSRLAAGPSSSQLALAEQMGYDKTRLIAVLDELAALGLVDREPDPTDRRARIVALTDAGRERLAAARADIRAMENGLLADLDPAAQAGLRATLAGLAPRDTPGDAERSPPEARRT